MMSEKVIVTSPLFMVYSNLLDFLGSAFLYTKQDGKSLSIFLQLPYFILKLNMTSPLLITMGS